MNRELNFHIWNYELYLAQNQPKPKIETASDTLAKKSAKKDASAIASNSSTLVTFCEEKGLKDMETEDMETWWLNICNDKQKERFNNSKYPCLVTKEKNW